MMHSCSPCCLPWAGTRWWTPAEAAGCSAVSSSGPADATLSPAPRSARRNSANIKTVFRCKISLTLTGFFLAWEHFRTPHLGRLLQLLCPLHDPQLCLLTGIFIFFISMFLTLRCPGGILQELRTQNQWVKTDIFAVSSHIPHPCVHWPCRHDGVRRPTPGSVSCSPPDCAPYVGLNWPLSCWCPPLNHFLPDETPDVDRNVRFKAKAEENQAQTVYVYVTWCFLMVKNSLQVKSALNGALAGGFTFTGVKRVKVIWVPCKRNYDT